MTNNSNHGFQLGKMQFEVAETLPRLAWCARIQRGRNAVTVRHGPWVERGQQAFYEGAWSGEATSLDFVSARSFTGSGGILADGAAIFATATHTLEPIHLMRLPEQVLCSNSLHFLLAEAGDAVTTNYLYYDADIMTIMFGTHRYQAAIPTANGNSVNQYYHCNVVVSPDLSVTVESKSAPPDFSNFADYSGFLLSETAAITRNAGDPSRRIRYKPLATISSGYDSPACAVFGRAAGCTEAFTFTTARPNFEDRDDSGSEIAKILGLNVTEFDYFVERPPRADFPEAEFIATGYGGDDVTMTVAEPLLAGKLIYTGYHGDKVWDKHNDEPTPYIVRGDTSGCSLAEFRLRIGFINLPVPFIGCLNHPAIHALSNSAEMAPWSLSNDYDRPIPRRIVEEAGVPRSLFGQAKKAIALPYQSNKGTNPHMTRMLSDASYRDFLNFINPIKRYRRLRHKLHYDLMHGLYALNLRATYSGKLRRALAIVRLKSPTRVVVPWKYCKPRTTNSLAFHWAAEKLASRYSRDAR